MNELEQKNENEIKQRIFIPTYPLEIVKRQDILEDANNIFNEKLNVLFWNLKNSLKLIDEIPK